jgi:hypothetical protein
MHTKLEKKTALFIFNLEVFFAVKVEIAGYVSTRLHGAISQMTEIFSLHLTYSPPC